MQSDDKSLRRREEKPPKNYQTDKKESQEPKIIARNRKEGKEESYKDNEQPAAIAVSTRRPTETTDFRTATYGVTQLGPAAERGGRGRGVGDGLGPGHSPGRRRRRASPSS